MTARKMLGAVNCNGKIYAMGGSFTSGDDGPVMTIVEEYDPSTNVWTTRTSLPTALNRARLAVVKGKIYVISGRGSGGREINCL
jgi:N-acetylneuraminic acid mutarotase